MEKKIFKVTKDDFDVSWFSGTGAGGQHRNRHMNCCRLKHKDTGIIKTGQSHREKQANQSEALNSMAEDPRFKSYCQIKLSELEKGKTIEEEVNEMLSLENLKIEVKENGKWREE